MSYNHKSGDSHSVGDNTTVVGGALSTMGDPNYLSESYPRKPSHNGKGIQMPVPQHEASSVRNFVENAEYMDTERPFFITIGKDGLSAALQKLDLQLRNVGS